MRALAFVAMLAVAFFASTSYVSALPTDQMPGNSCSTLGMTAMATDHASLVACVLNNPDPNATTCASGCTWKKMLSDSSPSGSLCGHFTAGPIGTWGVEATCSGFAPYYNNAVNDPISGPMHLCPSGYVLGFGGLASTSCTSIYDAGAWSVTTTCTPTNYYTCVKQ
jgi:hypothetical protein